MFGPPDFPGRFKLEFQLRWALVKPFGELHGFVLGLFEHHEIKELWKLAFGNLAKR